MLTVPSCEISRAWHRIHVFWRTCGLINACWLWVTPIVPMNLGLTKTCGRPDGWYTGWQLFATHGSPQLGNFRKDSDNGSGSLPEARWVLWFFPPGRKTFTTSLDSKMFVFLLNRFCFPLLMANILYQLICHYAILTRDIHVGHLGGRLGPWKKHSFNGLLQLLLHATHSCYWSCLSHAKRSCAREVVFLPKFGLWGSEVAGRGSLFLGAAHVENRCVRCRVLCLVHGPHGRRTKWLWLDSNIFKQYVTLISYSPFFCLISHYSTRVLFVSQLTCFCFLRDDLLRSSRMPQRDENCLVDFTSDLVLVHLVVMNSAFLGTKNDTSFCLLLEFCLVCVDLNSWNCEEEPRTNVGWNTWNSLDLGGHICSRVVGLVIMHV